MIKDPGISSLHARVLALLNSHHIKITDHMGTDSVDRGAIPFCSSCDSEEFPWGKIPKVYQPLVKTVVATRVIFALSGP